MSRRVVQPILGLVASAPRGLSPSQRELARRAGTHLSIQQRRAARRLSDAAQATAGDAAALPARVALVMPRLNFGRRMPPVERAADVVQSPVTNDQEDDDK